MSFTLLLTVNNNLVAVWEQANGVVVHDGEVARQLIDLPDELQCGTRGELAKLLRSVGSSLVSAGSIISRPHWHAWVEPISAVDCVPVDPEKWQHLVEGWDTRGRVWYDPPEWEDGEQVSYFTASAILDIPYAEARDIAYTWRVHLVKHEGESND